MEPWTIVDIAQIKFALGFIMGALCAIFLTSR